MYNVMTRPRIRITDNGWKCEGYVGHYCVIAFGLTIAEAYVRYKSEMFKLITESPLKCRR